MMFNKLFNITNKKSENKNYNDYSNLLSEKEYTQLKVFNKINRFNEIYESLKNNDEKFRKKDALWAVYNESRLEYEYKKDYQMLSVVFDRQVDILINDKKYQQALDTYTASLYLLLYNYDDASKEINLFDRHFNSRRIERLTKLIEHTKTSKKKYIEEFDVCIQEMVPSLYNKEKAKIICKNIIKRL